MASQVRKVRLDNGATLVMERSEHVRSVSVGVWVTVGSSIETPALSGMSHFIEHMTFKGTENRSSLELATVLESLRASAEYQFRQQYSVASAAARLLSSDCRRLVLRSV